MNNFPAMTEEQRQELIADLRVLLIDKDDEDKTPETLIARIALSALTAEPVAWVVMAPQGDYIERNPDVVAHLEGTGLARCGPLYTATPAPVLRVPDGWIKCSERYPEVGQEVLIRIPVCEKFNIENGKYEGDGRFLGAWFDTRGKGRPYKVTHWMPLPPPPEASNEHQA